MTRVKKKKISLRLRLAIMNIVILFIMCIVLTFGANVSGSKLVGAVNTTSAITNNILSEESSEEGALVTAQRNFKHETVYSMVFIIIMGSTLTFYLSGKVMKPLTKLSEEVANRDINNLSEKIVVEETGNEIENLAEAFNIMLEKINNSYVNQKNFSVNAAHELRTPLAVLQSKIEVFKKKENRSLDEYKHLIDIIGINTERLANIVKDLLEITNEDEIKLNESVNINEIIEECIFELEGIAEEKNISIKLIGDKVTLVGNDGLLQRAFYNLIENAIKYNIQDGDVIIKVVNDIDNIVIKIIDTGKGIPNNLKMDIFEAFTRVDKSRNREIGGNGLGLAIVKHIIAKHNGTIEVKDNKFKGSVFEIKFKV